jgi:hypothetical protein
MRVVLDSVLRRARVDVEGYVKRRQCLPQRRQPRIVKIEQIVGAFEEGASNTLAGEI